MNENFVSDMLGGIALASALAIVYSLASGIDTSTNSTPTVFFDAVACDHVVQDGKLVDNGCKNVDLATGDYNPQNADEEWARQDYARRRSEGKF